MLSFVDKFRKGLARTRQSLGDRIRDVITRSPGLDEASLEELEEILIQADVGIDASLRIVESLRERAKEKGAPPDVTDLIRSQIKDILRKTHDRTGQSPGADEIRPYVVLVVGVNGAGKTTTVGKLAFRHAAEGRKVLIAACDTFRAAAIDQLQVWADRAGADIVRHQQGADAASVAFDALSAADSRGADVVLIDTAGRLHTRVDLMEEVKKIRRVIGGQIEGAPHETLLVLDATTGQNALAQARQFGQDLEVTGIVLAKLDGTAKGGVVIAIADELGIPVTFVGLGEGSEDLAPFDLDAYASALFPELDAPRRLPAS